jgi:hypothetical protein
MTTIDCPLCAGTAHLDDALVALDCDACGVVEIAPETATSLDLAA